MLKLLWPQARQAASKFCDCTISKDKLLKGSTIFGPHLPHLCAATVAPRIRRPGAGREWGTHVLLTIYAVPERLHAPKALCPLTLPRGTG